MFAAGCLPRPEPAQPQPYPQQQPYAQQQQQQPYGQPQPYPQQQPQPTVAPAPAPATGAAPATGPAATTGTENAQGGVTVAATNPSQPPPFPAAQQPPPLPAAQGNYYAPQPYPPPQPYAQPYPAPAYPAPAESRRRHWNDGEVIADFAVVGTFGSLNLLARTDIDNGNAVGFLLVGGMAGGAGVGYLLTQNYDVDAGAAHATTLGMTLGFANGALLIQPTGWSRTESVLNLLFLGSAAGAAGGFAYGQAAKLTPGQSYFVANMTMLGAATAAFGAISGSRDGEFGNWENGTLAIGIDGGAVAGAVIAPSLDWSAKRSKVVFAATAIGALAGGMFAGLLANGDGESRTDNGDVVAGAMTAGLWGGFGLGVMMTKNYTPDMRFAQPSAGPTAVRQRSESPTTVMPWVGDRGQLGVMTGGSF